MLQSLVLCLLAPWPAAPWVHAVSPAPHSTDTHAEAWQPKLSPERAARFSSLHDIAELLLPFSGQRLSTASHPLLAEEVVHLFKERALSWPHLDSRKKHVVEITPLSPRVGDGRPLAYIFSHVGTDVTTSADRRHADLTEVPPHRKISTKSSRSSEEETPDDEGSETTSDNKGQYTKGKASSKYLSFHSESESGEHLAPSGHSSAAVTSSPGGVQLVTRNENMSTENIISHSTSTKRVPYTSVSNIHYTHVSDTLAPDSGFSGVSASPLTSEGIYYSAAQIENQMSSNNTGSDKVTTKEEKIPVSGQSATEHVDSKSHEGVTEMNTYFDDNIEPAPDILNRFKEPEDLKNKSESQDKRNTNSFSEPVDQISVDVKGPESNTDADEERDDDFEKYGSPYGFSNLKEDNNIDLQNDIKSDVIDLDDTPALFVVDDDTDVIMRDLNKRVEDFSVVDWLREDQHHSRNRSGDEINSTRRGDDELDQVEAQMDKTREYIASFILSLEQNRGSGAPVKQKITKEEPVEFKLKSDKWSSQIQTNSKKGITNESRPGGGGWRPGRHAPWGNFYHLSFLFNQ